MADYTLYYWPIPFRGHFIRYVLAHVGADWREADFNEVAARKNQAVAEQPYPFMAPPLLEDHKNGRTHSQLPAILLHLAEEHKLSAHPQDDLRLICDASDILFEITRYHGALVWDQRSWIDFCSERLPRWMQIHERIVADGGIKPDAGYLWGSDEPTLGDLVLAALWHTMIDRLPPLRPLLRTNAPTLEGLVDRVAVNAGIASLLSEWSGRKPLYCAGQIEASLLTVLDMETDE